MGRQRLEKTLITKKPRKCGASFLSLQSLCVCIDLHRILIPTLMEKIEKEIKVTRYVAFDGTEFETEAECRHYEGSAFGELLQQLKDCTLGAYFTSDGHKCYCLLPKTRHDIFVLSQIMKMAGFEQPCAYCYDHLTLLTVHLECNTVTFADVTNLEDHIAAISNGQYAVVSTIKPAEKAVKCP